MVLITCAVFTRSVHIASTAWAFSEAVCADAIGADRLRFGFSTAAVCSFFDVIGYLLVVHTKFQFSLLRLQDDRLAVHPPHHVKGRLRLPSQRHLEQVL